MMSVTLTKSDQLGKPLPNLTYQFNPDSFYADLLDHPDFRVEDQINLDVIVYGAGEHGYPVEMSRQRNDTGDIYNMCVGFVDQHPESFIEEELH